MEISFVLMLSSLAAKHFGVATSSLPKMDAFPESSHWIECWRCDVIAKSQSDNYYCLLSNAKSLYSFILLDQDRDVRSIISMLSQLLNRHIKLAGCLVDFHKGGTFRLVRGQPRKVISCQNELTRRALYLLANDGGSYDDICRELNRTIILTLPGAYPEAAFQSLVASDPPAAYGDGGGTNNIIPFS